MSSVYQNKDLGVWFLCNELTKMQIKSCFQDTFANRCCRHLCFWLSADSGSEFTPHFLPNRLHSQTAMITNTHCTAHHVPPVPRFSGVFTSFHSYRESTSSLSSAATVAPHEGVAPHGVEHFCEVKGPHRDVAGA